MNQELLSLAQKRDTTPFDYVIVGAGAGGGPLAARLALGGKRVLVIEAGSDPAKQRSRDFPDAAPGEIHDVPGYHASATEDKELSWQFSVRHYDDTARQKKDEKYNQLSATIGNTPYPPHPRFHDAPGHPRGKRGILYPRSAGIGGCTAHHAMIVVAPNDKDWDYIANLTGDDSWRASQMRGYFTKLENCLYLDAYATALRKLLGLLYELWRWIVFLFSPRSVLDEGGHGRNGWQPTTFLDPNLIEGIARSDKGFFQLLARTALSVLHRDRKLIGLIKNVLFRFRLVAQIDPNDQNTRRVSPEGIFLIPTGIQSSIKNGDGKVMTGCREGVREFVLDTAKRFPDRLVIATGFHVTRVIFEKPRPDEPGVEKPGPRAPRAIGVEAAPGEHLYEASPLQPASLPSARIQFFTRGEVILSGGAFNTPQILMLSGIGDSKHLKNVRDNSDSRAEGIEGLRDAQGTVIAPVVNLPGVGRNLQDRYEVSVISELDRELEVLKGLTFTPGDTNDPARKQWQEKRTGLYAGNGGTLALIKRSAALSDDEHEPDLFIFGAPAAFRGYYWGWSRELFHRLKGAPKDERKLWSWVILKAYTQNKDGFVRLRTNSPFDQPEICFDSFNESAEKAAATIRGEIERLQQAKQAIPKSLLDHQAATERVLISSHGDLAGLSDAVKTVRAINGCNPTQFVQEIQPGLERPDDSEELKEWIKTQAWGHHASCTCRMGADSWKEEPDKLTDPMAVLDSRFRVHGVQNLRVVDASVFPAIPGYFILAPTLMISEKAADVLLQDALEAVYPLELREKEMAAVGERRRVAQVPAANPGTGQPVTVGLALSGGGIRSATFSIGVLQAFAERGRLRYIDFLSTASGGAFTGSFLGRLFTRKTTEQATDPAGRVQEILRDPRSAPLWWLRSQANYILGAGTVDLRQNLAIYFRNLFTVHLVIGAVLFAAFGLLREVGVRLPAVLKPGGINFRGEAIPLSMWWWLPAAVLVLGIVPAALGYWLAPKPKSAQPHPLPPLTAWVILLAACVVILNLPGGVPFAIAGFVVLTAAWLWQEMARWGCQIEEQGTVVRNRLTRSLGEVLVVFAFALFWVALDTLAAYVAVRGKAPAMTMILVGLAPFLPILRKAAEIGQRQFEEKKENLFLTILQAVGGVVLAVFLLLAMDVFVHALFLRHEILGCWGIIIALLFSAAIGHALDFLNGSSLHAAYTARLVRTFQGASNEARIYSSTTNESHDVQLAHPEDDIPFYRYHPEQRGGPLHLIGVCVNETIDTASEREVRERKGLSMCVGPLGVSVGRRFHAVWVPSGTVTRRENVRLAMEGRRGIPGESLKPLLASNNPGTFHVFASRQSDTARVESLTLGAWTGISGAAFSTGTGRGTNWRMALLMGLVNLRLGYWWNSGISGSDRPGQYPRSLWRKLKHLPSIVFRMQSLLISEWRALFSGPSRRFWYLSDGGHFDNTALYELLRRRVEFIICSDAGADPSYRWNDLANLARQAREDFDAEITWLGPSDLSLPDVPGWVRDWIDVNGLGKFSDIKCDGSGNAALGRVRYARGTPVQSWLLLLKPCVLGTEPFDVANYKANNPLFPQQPTSDQFFDDEQWESYRALGQFIARKVFREAPAQH